jgi:hypothetical protein
MLAALKDLQALLLSMVAANSYPFSGTDIYLDADTRPRQHGRFWQLDGRAREDATADSAPGSSTTMSPARATSPRRSPTAGNNAPSLPVRTRRAQRAWGPRPSCSLAAPR